MDSIELMPIFRNILQGISLDELKGIPGLRVDVHADYLAKPSTVVAHRSPTSPAE
jgi:hypothetical protein